MKGHIVTAIASSGLTCLVIAGAFLLVKDDFITRGEIPAAERTQIFRDQQIRELAAQFDDFRLRVSSDDTVIGSEAITEVKESILGLEELYQLNFEMIDERFSYLKRTICTNESLIEIIRTDPLTYEGLDKFCAS
ncbi:MAG TPA: hypothetical protein VI759_02205 [Dehalococcoidia bacterium]|nr:hypothetical protein [Dehalococcoidia bacterium]